MNLSLAQNTADSVNLDLRTLPGFVAALFPLVNGAPLFSIESDPSPGQLVMQFLAAYYKINVRWMELRAVRSRPDASDLDQQERTALQALEAALRERDELEDRHAPAGVIAEPVFENGFACNVQISFGHVDVFGRTRSDLYTISTSIPFPLPPGTKLEDLPFTIDGPGLYDPGSTK